MILKDKPEKAARYFFTYSKDSEDQKKLADLKERQYQTNLKNLQ